MLAIVSGSGFLNLLKLPNVTVKKIARYGFTTVRLVVYRNKIPRF